MDVTPTPYAKMYAILCCAASETIDLIIAGQNVQAALKLQNALHTAEDLGIDSQSNTEETKNELL